MVGPWYEQIPLDFTRREPRVLVSALEKGYRDEHSLRNLAGRIGVAWSLVVGNSLRDRYFSFVEESRLKDAIHDLLNELLSNNDIAALHRDLRKLRLTRPVHPGQRNEGRGGGATRLISTLAELIADPHDIQNVADSVDLSTTLDNEDGARELWTRLLEDARNHQRIDRIIELVVDDFPGLQERILQQKADYLDAFVREDKPPPPLRMRSRRPNTAADGATGAVLFEDDIDGSARTMADMVDGLDLIEDGLAVVVVAHHQVDVEAALLDLEAIACRETGAATEDVAWIRAEALLSASPDDGEGTDAWLLRQLKPTGVNEATFARHFEERLDGRRPLVIILDLSRVAALDANTKDNAAMAVSQARRMRSIDVFIKRLRAARHVGVIGITRAALTLPALRPPIFAPPTVLMAAPLFGTAPASSGPAADHLGRAGALVAAAVGPLLGANSPELRRRAEAELARLAADQAASGADRDRQLRTLVAFASRLTESGFLDPAYRIEQFCRNTLEAVKDETARLDLWSRVARQTVAYGHLESLIDLPMVGERVLLTGGTGFDASTLLRCIERAWMLPGRGRGGTSKAWLPLAVGALVEPEADVSRHFERRASVRLGGGPVPLRATAALERAALTGTLHWLISSRLLFLVTELGDTEEGSAVARFLDPLLAKGPFGAGLILSVATVDAAPFLSRWFREEFETFFEARLCLLDLHAALERVQAAAADTLRGLFADPDHPMAEHVGKPYVVAMIDVAVRERIDLADVTLFDLVRDTIERQSTSQGGRVREAVEDWLPALAFASLLSEPTTTPDSALVAGQVVLDLLLPGRPPRFRNGLIMDVFVAAYLRANWGTAGPRFLDRLSRERADLWKGLFGDTLAIVMQALDPAAREQLARFLIDAGQFALAHRSLCGLRAESYAESAAARDCRDALVAELDVPVGARSEQEFKRRRKVARALAQRDPRIARDYDPAAFAPVGGAGGGILLARFPVTNSQYARFVHAGGYRHRPFWADDDRPSPGWEFVNSGIDRPASWTALGTCRPNHPVVGVSLPEALAFCRWFGEQLPGELVCALPRARDWLLATGITDCLAEDHSVSIAELEAFEAEHRVPYEVPQGGVPIGVFPPNRRGISDLLGNVWEWCDDWASDPGGPTPPSAALAVPAPPVLVHGGPCSSMAQTMAALRGGALDAFARSDAVGFRMLLRPATNPEQGS